MSEAWKQWEGRVVNEEFPLLRYLGGSEQSAVFLTKRTDREPQEVAIKLILSNGDNPELQLSWWELAAKLSHPHLLRLFQRGRCQVEGKELVCAVTEYAEESLAQILPYRALTPQETRDMLQSVLDALGYIHAKGFVHGHIKPANIMAVGNEIKLSSDGLCGVGELSRVLRMPGIYAAPEIVEGGGVSPASDVWSLGMTLVEALTQHPPAWTGTEQAELVLPETLPAPFFDIASHCLRREPQRRWTVAEIKTKLQQTTLPVVQAKEVQPPGGPTKWGYAVAAIAAVLLLTILGTRLIHRHPGTGSEPSGPGQSSAGQPATKQGAGSGEPASISPPAAARPNPSHAAARADSTKKDSATSAAGAQGAVAQQILPEVSRSALRTIHGKLKVRVKVRVDSSGNVTVASFDSRGPSKYFADRVWQAARRWTFKPPQVNGQGVPSEWILKFEFERSGINVHPVQVFP
jgi:TonB family protein